MKKFRLCAPFDRFWRPFIPVKISYALLSFFVVLISSIICFFPDSTGIDETSKNMQMVAISESRTCQDAMLISAIIGLPMILDMTLDGFAVTKATTAEQIHWATRFLLLMSLMLPSIFLYTKSITSQVSANSFVSVMALMNVTSRGSIVIFLGQDHHNIGLGPVCV